MKPIGFRWTLVILITASLSGWTGCQARQAEQVGLTSSLPRRPGWTARADAVVQAGDFMAKGLWGDPCVLKVEGQYVMYMTSSTKDPFKPPVLPFRAVSTDGIAWKLDPARPLLQPPNSNVASVETPSVVRFKGQYHMYYSAIARGGGPAGMAIGHAVSSDGIAWTGDTEPVLKSSGVLADWNGYLVGEPGALVYDDKIYLFYCAVGARPGGNPPQLQTIALAISDDGKQFGPQRSVFGQTETYPPSKGFNGYSTPSPLLHNGRIHIFYDVSHFEKGRDPEWQQVALHHAVSNDGGKSFVQDSAPFFTRDQLDWTQGEILAPTVIVDGTQLKMWFGGHVRNKDLGPLILRGIKGREFGVGLATADVSWLD